MSETLAAELEFCAACLCTEMPASTTALLRSGVPLAWIGSGLSRLAAEVGMRWSIGALGCPATRFTPLEYCALPRSPYLPILLTYGGRNNDSLAVVDQILAHSSERAVLVTGREGSRCEERLRDAAVEVEPIHAPDHPAERRFVALFPYLGMTALAQRVAEAGSDPRPALSDFERGLATAHEQWGALREQLLAIPDWRDRRWIVLGGDLTLAGAMAWQVLFSEAALADLLVVDIKDYSHGRYNSALQRDDVAYLLLSDDPCHNLALTVSKRFSTLYPTVHIHARGARGEAMWTHLILAAAMVSELSAAVGFDLADPPRPEVVRSWANWGRIKISRPDSPEPRA